MADVSFDEIEEGRSERWWLGASNPGEGWQVFTPGGLPTDAADYLAPAVIVLENIAATDLGTLGPQ